MTLTVAYRSRWREKNENQKIVSRSVPASVVSLQYEDLFWLHPPTYAAQRCSEADGKANNGETLHCYSTGCHAPL